MIPMKRLVAFLLAAAYTNPSQLWVTANGGVKRKMADKLGDVVSVKDYTGLQAAINAVGANGTVYVPAGYTETLTSGLTISNSGVTLKIEPGVVITKGASGSMINITASGFTLDGGTWDGNQAGGFTGQGIIVNAVDKTTIRNATIKNQASQGIYVLNSTNLTVTGNTITACQGIGLFVSTGLVGGIISGNIIDNTGGAQANISIHSGSPGRDAKNIVVSNNRLTNGNATAFCVELVSAGGGNATINNTITGNNCEITGNTYGCYSVGLTGSLMTVASNTCNMNNFAGTIAGIEVVSQNGSAVTGNVINGGANLQAGIWLHDTSDTTVTDNVINGFQAGGYGGITLQSASATAPTSRNVISGNRITMPASGATTYGILMAAQNAGSVMTGNSIVGNVIQGNGAATTDGIRIALQLGAISATTVANNYVDNVINGINISNSATSALIEGNNFGASVTNSFAGTLTSAIIVNPTGTTQANLGAPANGSNVYCSDCNTASACTAGGTGAFASRQNGAWKCL